MLTKGSGINGSEVDGALVLKGHWLQVLSKLLALLCSFSENVSKRKTSAHIALVSIWANLTNDWCGSSLGELLNCLSIKLLGEGVLALIK